MIWISGEVSAEVWGNRVRQISCERCQGRYAYLLVRAGMSQLITPYMLFANSLRRLAGWIARERLEQALADDAEAVACPHCGRVQASMLAAYQRGYRSELRARAAAWGMGVFVVMGVAALGFYVVDPSISAMLAMVGLVGAVLTSAAVLAFRRARARAIDVELLQTSPPLPGTPPALVEQADGALVPAAWAFPLYRHGWVMLQNGRHDLPAVCVRCLGDAEGTYHRPIAVVATSGSGAVCRKCGRAMRRRWWVWMLVALLLACIAPLPLLLGSGGSEIDRVLGYGFAVLVLGLVAVGVVPNVLVAGLRIRAIDARRGVIAVRSGQNRGWAELVARRLEHIEQSSVLKRRKGD